MIAGNTNLNKKMTKHIYVIKQLLIDIFEKYCLECVCFISGAELSDFFRPEKSNGKRSSLNFDEDLGPETNVDDLLSPTAKKYEENIFKEEGFEGHYNPFMEHQEKAAIETEKLMKKKDDEEYKENVNREEDDQEFDYEVKKVCEETTEKEEVPSEFQQQLEDAQRLAREETPTPPADTGR